MECLRKTLDFIDTATTRTISLLGHLLLRELLPVAELRFQLRYLQAKAAELQDLDKQILEAVGDDKLENELTAAEEYKQNINQIKTLVELVLPPPCQFQNKTSPTLTSAWVSRRRYADDNAEIVDTRTHP